MTPKEQRKDTLQRLFGGPWTTLDWDRDSAGGRCIPWYTDRWRAKCARVDPASLDLIPPLGAHPRYSIPRSRVSRN